MCQQKGQFVSQIVANVWCDGGNHVVKATGFYAAHPRFRYKVRSALRLARRHRLDAVFGVYGKFDSEDCVKNLLNDLARGTQSCFSDNVGAIEREIDNFICAVRKRMRE